MAVVGQSGHLAPADKKLYALRDVTATVDSLPLIASSIMSKKLAAGAHSIVLDVKFGSGAFMKTLTDASALARAMVDIGRACGRNMTAVLTDMDRPLGYAIGNALEVAEAVGVLRGGGPQDLRAVSLELAAQMASLALGLSEEEARRRAEAALDGGAAWETFLRFVAAQGGDTAAVEDTARLPRAALTVPVTASADGFVTHMDTEAVGGAAVVLGAGRERKEDAIDPAAGIVLVKKPGDAVRAGETLAVLHTDDARRAADGEAAFRAAVTIGPEAPPASPLIAQILR